MKSVYSYLQNCNIFATIPRALKISREVVGVKSESN
jgi:hypothetical protein